jgi:hypothetical protein
MSNYCFSERRNKRKDKKKEKKKHPYKKWGFLRSSNILLENKKINF